MAITAGLSEPGADGAPGWSRRRCAIARAAGAVLVGPNCLGIVDTGTEPPAQPRRAAGRATSPCSARAATSCSTWPRCSRTAGLGVARFVSRRQPGRPRRVVDLMRACVAHDGHPGGRGLRRGRGRRPGLRRRRARAASTPASRWSCSRPGRSEAAVRSAGLAHRLADQRLAGGRRGVRGRGRPPGGQPDPDGRPAGRRCSADRRMPGRPGRGAHRRRRPRRRSPPTRSPPSGWRRRCSASATRGALRGALWARLHRHQPGRPRRRRRAGPAELRARRSRRCWRPRRSTACC